MPGCITKFAMLVSGSSQPKYSKSRKRSRPSPPRRALWVPMSDGMRVRNCGREVPDEIEAEPAVRRVGTLVVAAQLGHQRAVEEGREFRHVVLHRLEAGVAPLDLGHDSRPRQAGLRRLADLRAGPQIDTGVQTDLERREIGNVAVARRGHGLAVEPRQEREAPLRRHGGDPRRAIDALALHEAKRAHLGLEPVAVVGCRIFLQGKPSRRDSTRKMRLLPPRRISARPVTGSPHRVRATSRISVRKRGRGRHEVRSRKGIARRGSAGPARTGSCGSRPACRRAPGPRPGRR